MRLLYGLLCVLWLAGCSSTPTVSGADQGASAQDASRLITQTASLRLEVKKLETSVAAMQQSVSVSGGYAKNLYMHEDERATLVCDIPQPQLTGFLIQTKALGKVLGETHSADDITDKSLNVDAELKSLYQLRDRTLALLQKTKDIKEILQVEQQLKQIESRIGYLEQQKKSQVHQVRYSEVRVELKRHRVLGPLGMLFYGVVWTVEKLFVIR